ncbi:MAG: VWA domain-containing protein [Candidatus Marinimicrobia bacterium]|nr:VWA domain-containing protein [Candidatus Neomarinimicrobiota bacterium]MDD4960660.1 VWA domain-containing protein [Candidatus Neomarinimicrobiota bacterium]MDD5709085.1 VWA domain-containing protein [Candidatus Neomarinimicrobiota bacterium]
MFRFAYPYVLLLILPFSAVLIIVYFYRQRQQRALRMGASPPAETLLRPFYYKILLPELLLFFTVIFLLFALARPQRGNVSRELRQSGIDIMLALDISGSMQLNDFKPNRLEASKQVARDFVQNRKHDRVGLVVFAGESFLQCPLTTDYDIVSELIGKMEIVPQSLDGTAIGLAIVNCINRLRDTEAKSKVIILLTDGENNAGDIDPITAASFAKDYNVRIYTIGMAGSGEQISSGFLFSQRIPPLNDRLLREIAEKTQGRFYRADSEEKLKEVWDEIAALEKTEINMRQYMDWDERYFPFLLAALLLALFAYILKYVVWRRAGC